MQTTGEQPGLPARPAGIAAPFRASAKRRLIESGIGGTLALIYWGVVLAMFLVAFVFVLIVMGPGITLVWVIACFAAWGFGILLMIVVGGLAFVPRLRRAALGFVVASAAANVVLVIALVVGVVAINLIATSG